MVGSSLEASHPAGARPDPGVGESAGATKRAAARGGSRADDPRDEKPRRRPPPKLYKIGEVMQFTGLSRQTIHNYTMLGLITEEARTPSGHRLYGEGVFDRLERIQRLKERMSLKEVRDALDRGEA